MSLLVIGYQIVIFLIVYIRKFIVNMKRKEKLDELDKDVEEENTNEE